jgi:cytochrome b
MSNTLRVWDLPTRIFHWSLVLCVLGLVITGQLGGAALDWHFRLGYAVLTLLLFRLLWGFVGGHWSRFTSFTHSPAALLRYLRGQGEPALSVGHSPLGMLSVFAMLFFLLLQVGSGLISDDEIASSGPLARFAAAALVSQATSYHKEIGKLILIALVLLHVAAVLFYLWRKHINLIRPMLHGDKPAVPALPASRDDARSRLQAALLLLLCAALVAALLAWAG